MNERATLITNEIVEAIRGVLRKNNVTFGEYRAGFMHLVKTQQAGEIPLLTDVFFNSTIVDIENESRKGTRADLQGPYFVPDAPVITDGQIAVEDEHKDKPVMVLRGKVTDLEGNPVAGAEIDIWHSTPDGRYSGIEKHGNMDKKFYRGRVMTSEDGSYEARSITPVPYQIPNKGPTGHLLENIMGGHSWRPAHVHYWVKAPGLRDVINQAYFEGDEWIGNDSCNGGLDEMVIPEVIENGERIMEVDFKLEPAVAKSLQAAE
ncbi:MAG: dioxygenase [Paracoccaceae bacterium]|nr:dioxygenase [Paracoccaceae bacterium]